MENKQSIFMVEDDRNFGTVLKAYLEMNGYNVNWVKDGMYAISKFREQEYNICILDVMLPNVDGFSIATQIRDLNPNVPIIFLTAKTLKEDVLQGFSIGADDYITKPFDSEILLAKIKAILSRKKESSEQPETVFHIGKNGEFDSYLRTLSINGNKITLSPKESDLLRLLCNRKNKVLQRDTALIQIWGETGYFTTRSMDVFITKIRKYLKEIPEVEIINIHGSGYMLRENDGTEN